jgi:hypothetical protein
MRHLAIIAAAAALLAFAARPVDAATCNVDGTSYPCDLECAASSCDYSSFTFTQCEQAGTADGVCVICGNGSANTITGTTSGDIICGKGGNDVLHGDPASSGAGDTIRGEAGNDTINGRFGNDHIDGGDGDDNITGGDGDDEIAGGEDDDNISGNNGDDDLAGDDGVDIIFGNAGADVLRGGDDSDYLEGSSAPFINGALGDIMCGGKGDDVLQTLTLGSNCFDPGPDQLGLAFDYGWDCNYLAPQHPTSGDLATERNCVTIKYDSSAFHSSNRSCNCQD